MTLSIDLCAASEQFFCPLIRAVDPKPFQGCLRRLHKRFSVYAATSPEPLPAPGLVVTPEIRLQSRLYLPMGELRSLFWSLYRKSLTYTPVLSSTPFYNALSWADGYAALPAWLQRTANPARILEELLQDQELLTRFIFFSFLPDRFNGQGFDRYPGQLAWLRRLLAARPAGPLRILDAACGSGEGTWELVELTAAAGAAPSDVRIEGWTIDPLEVWAARQRCLPHAPTRQHTYRTRVLPLVRSGWDERVMFTVQDLCAVGPEAASFDLIICNGLLGGPLLHQQEQMLRVIGSLSLLLAPGGFLAVADRFHGGWKKQVPETLIADMLRDRGLTVEQAGEGLAARMSV